MKQIISILTILLPFSLFSQIIENFDGPEITSANPWKGELYEFFINQRNELEFISLPGEGGEASIYLPHSYTPSMSWEIEVMTDFKPTNSNNARLYIYSTENMQHDEMYYVQVGNNNGQISFYRQTGSGNTICISGRKNITDTPYRKIYIRVTLDNNDTWTLYTRNSDENDYTKEGSYKRILSNPLSLGIFKITCRYIKSRMSGFYFDNLKISFEDDDTPGITPPPEPGPPPTNEYSSGSILINEVMADPKGVAGLPETEYIELHNTTDNAIPLQNWILYYGTSAIVIPGQILPAKGYIVLFKEGRDIRVDTGGIAFPLPNFPNALANTGKDLSLYDPAGNKIDESRYEKATPGYSWERTGTGWQLSVDSRGGTPGSANSVPDVTHPVLPDGEQPEPLDIIFNELLPEPFPDGSEFIELYNRSNKTLSLSGLIIAVRKTDGTFATHYPLSGIPCALLPDSYLVVTKSKPGVTSFYTIPDEDVIYEIKIPVLSNTSTRLVLFRKSDETVIDEINYSSKWHSSSLISKKGVSLERINPEFPTQDESNWNSASAITGYATPGAANSQQTDTKEENKPITLGKPIYHPNGTYSIPYTLDKAGYYCRAYIYSLSGNNQVEVINHLLMGTSGDIAWDGNNKQGGTLKTGLYILYVEFYHPEGGNKKFKVPLPVR